MALVDVFDALMSKRVYKESFGIEESFKIIREERGVHFDPKIVDAFFDIEVSQIEQIYFSTTQLFNT